MSKKIKLILDKNPKKATELTQAFSDQFWEFVQVEIGEENQLITENGTVIRSNNQIINFLNKKKRISIFNNLHLAIKRVLKFLKMNKSIKADHTTIKNRRSICNSCRFIKKNPFFSKCSICGCFTKAKTTLLTESCPKDKW